MIKRIATLLLGIGLIGLGVLFFLAPQGSWAIQLLIRYWPLFLILAGIVRVAGYLIDRHPKSPVSGMLITAIGGILLAANLLGHNSFLLVLGKYWFWLLMAFVAGRVMKQYLHRTSDGLLRPRAFAPGAIAVMLLIVASGLAANYFVQSGREINLPLGNFGEVGGFIFGNELTIEDPTPQSFPISSDTRLTFNNIRGDIEINSAPQTEATARIIKRVRAASEADAKERAKKISLQIAAERNNFQFGVNTIGEEQGFSATIIVTVPQQFASHLEINNPQGNVKIHRLRGDHTIRGANRIEVQQNAGSVTIENPRGEVELKQIHADVKVKGASQSVSLQDASGKISLELKGGGLTAENIAGQLQIRASGARLEMHNIDSESGGEPALINLRDCRINLQEIKGNLDISAERSQIEVKGVNGDLSVKNSGERILISRIEGSLQIKAENGAVEVEEIHGPATITADNDIRVKDFYGPMQVSSARGKISLETDQKLKNDLTATCERGRIRVSIPQDSPFQLDASTMRGRIRLGGFEQIELRRNERSTVLGYNLSDSTSSPQVRLRSGSGDIQLRSSGLAPASAEDDSEKD